MGREQPRQGFRGWPLFGVSGTDYELELVVPTAARTLGLRESGVRPLFERLEEHLQDKQLLLVLDNFEQVLGAAPTIVELLSACPELKVLVTSREALQVSGEQEFPVSPLEAPDPGHLDVNAVAGYPAVELFARRARAAKPDFEVTSANAAQVARICHRLDELPLAIELAAARIRLLSPGTMLDRLEFRILTGGARDAPARQKTLKSTIEWSYDLLEEDEQGLFRHLAVFVGGCALEAVEEVAGEPETLDLLEALVTKKQLMAER